jgi:hypothetical protein
MISWSLFTTSYVYIIEIKNQPNLQVFYFFTGSEFMEESSFVLPAEEYDQAPSNLRIIQAAKSNPRAFGELYLLYVQPVFRYLYSRVGNLHDAEDLTAQTFLTALEALDGLREESHFAAWLFTIARHKAMDTFRRKKNETSIDEIAQMGDDPDPLSGVIHSE